MTSVEHSDTAIFAVSEFRYRVPIFLRYRKSESVPNPKNKGISWRQKSYLSNYRDTGEYFDNYQRAQLKAILSQVNSKLTLRLTKVNTRDVGIQESPTSPTKTIRFLRTITVYLPVAAGRQTSFQEEDVEVQQKIGEAAKDDVPSIASDKEGKKQASEGKEAKKRR
ncbi:unnamed protein product [Ranitomeya imitator]|uniref:Ribosomal protein S10 n=1 Tax=Ranitomeya imitator TaxID=111125 RepID=A0ABN9MPW3_9NEOB|nr:unnamed protein product [Ranitomeya imitator]